MVGLHPLNVALLFGMFRIHGRGRSAIVQVALSLCLGGGVLPVQYRRLRRVTFALGR